MKNDFYIMEIKGYKSAQKAHRSKGEFILQTRTK